MRAMVLDTTKTGGNLCLSDPRHIRTQRLIKVPFVHYLFEHHFSWEGEH